MFARIFTLVRDLWLNEPAVLRAGIAGVVGLAFLVAGTTLDVDSVAQQIFDAIGALVILGSGLFVRPKVTPYDRDQ